ncbi:MAG: YlxM family DNA-binding protein [Anaerovoracaceae bacterium]|jgi:predicted DNA-binding protein YlxM (UPF0122 family)
MDDFLRIGMLHDFYGALLTDRQNETVRLYYEENCSLAEIAQELGVSRQAVHDSLKSAEAALAGYEEKLGLARKFAKTEEAIEKIDAKIDEIIKSSGDDKLARKLEEIKAVLGRIDG